MPAPVKFILFIMLAMGGAAKAQNPSAGSAKNIIGKIESIQQTMPAEKLYLQLDKPQYFAGDTIWFKAYLVNAGSRQASLSSAKLYVELINDSSRVIDRRVIPLNYGLGSGDFTLFPQAVSDGAYTIRAYTNWMKNFGEDAFFHQRFYVGNTGARNSWLISEQHTVKNIAEGKKINLALRLTDIKNLPIVNDKVQLIITSGNKPVYKKVLSTSIEGGIITELTLPASVNTHNLNIVLQGVDNKTNRQTFPFYPRGDEQNTDLQFMPEGGSMVAGLLNKVAFKALGEDGLGMNVNGSIVDSKDNEIAVFGTAKNGMGGFRLVPLANETYRAKIKSTGGAVKYFPLPQILTSGTTLRVDNVSNTDTVNVLLACSTDIKLAGKGYTLLALAKDTALFTFDVDFSKGYYNLSIPINKFKTGIVNFTLLDARLKPVNERKIFVNHHDQLRVKAVPDKLSYQPKDSVSVEVLVTDAKGTPVKGSFSVAVIDDGQVKQQKYAGNILSSMLLTSELKGNIEEPGWYFADENATEAPRTLDNLMLTQGWTGFDWSTLNSDPGEPRFAAESNNSVSGKLINFLHKPVSNAKVTLLISSPESTMLTDTLSDKQGRFNFNNLPYLDSVAYTVKVHNKSGSAFGGGVTVDEITRATPMPLYVTSLMPWFTNTDTTLNRYFQSTIANKKAMDKISMGDVKGKLLNEVTIKARRKTTLKGIDGAAINYFDVLLDEKELAKVGRKTLLDFLETGVHGFHSMAFYHGNPNDVYFMDGNVMIDIIIDGINVNRFYSYSRMHNDHFTFLTSYLNSVLAADLKELVIYHEFYIPAKTFVSYLVIKTRGGQGPALRSTPGVYVYRPDPVYKARQFYKPRYQANNSYDKQMIRPTIHWEPNVITDKDGKATISFYAADKPSTYTLSIEGTNLLGAFGYQSATIKVDGKTSN